MARQQSGTTPLERLRTHYEEVDLVCPECGHDDEGGQWTSRTDGQRVLYRHVCPSCGAIRARTLRV